MGENTTRIFLVRYKGTEKLGLKSTEKDWSLYVGRNMHLSTGKSFFKVIQDVTDDFYSVHNEILDKVHSHG